MLEHVFISHSTWPITNTHVTVSFQIKADQIIYDCNLGGPGWGLVFSIPCWVPPVPPMPEKASLFRSGVPLYSPLQGHLLWNLALITPGLAGSYLILLFPQIGRPLTSETLLLTLQHAPIAQIQE